jgi:hypothetical protein
MFVLLFNLYRVRFLDVEVRWNFPPLRVRQIFRYPKRDNLPVTSRRSRVGANQFFESSQIFTSQFLHFCVTWEMGWPFCWNQQLRPAHRSGSLLECLDSDVEFNLIKDENLGGNEPDCETNHERPERE